MSRHGINKEYFDSFDLSRINFYFEEKLKKNKDKL